MSGHWWCQHCNQELSPRQVTFEENHDNCGGTAIWIEQEDIGEIEFLKMQLAEEGKQVDELQAQVAVLRGALEEVSKGHIESRFDHEDGRFVEVFVRDVHIVIDQALEQTPAESALRVQKLVEVEKAAREYVESNSIKMSIWLGSSESLRMEKINKLEALRDALDALSEWRRDK